MIDASPSGSTWRLVEALPEAEEYERLRAAVGWATHPLELVRAALPRSLFGVCAYDQDRLVGMARLIGDGGLAWYIQDVVVLPAYQRQGIGHALMARIMAYIEERAQPGTFVGLMAAAGKEEFYARYGFERRPAGAMGCGMSRMWRAEPLPDEAERRG